MARSLVLVTQIFFLCTAAFFSYSDDTWKKSFKQEFFGNDGSGTFIWVMKSNNLFASMSMNEANEAITISFIETPNSRVTIQENVLSVLFTQLQSQFSEPTAEHYWPIFWRRFRVNIPAIYQYAHGNLEHPSNIQTMSPDNQRHVLVIIQRNRLSPLPNRVVEAAAIISAAETATALIRAPEPVSHNNDNTASENHGIINGSYNLDLSDPDAALLEEVEEVALQDLTGYSQSLCLPDSDSRNH